MPRQPKHLMGNRMTGLIRHYWLRRDVCQQKNIELIKISYRKDIDVP